MSNNNLTRIEIANVLNKEVGISRSEASYFVDTIAVSYTHLTLPTKA